MRNKEKNKVADKVCLINASDKERNETAKKCKPLVIKIVSQFNKKTQINWNDLESAGWEGLTLAMNEYDPAKSKMNFVNYAAFRIRNNILNRTYEENSAIKTSQYIQEKNKEMGISNFKGVSITTVSGTQGSDEDGYSREYKYGLYSEDRNNIDKDPFDILIDFVKNKFKSRDQFFFFSYFALDNHKQMKMKDIAAKENTTVVYVSMRVKKVVDAIKANKSLVETLRELVA